MSDKLLNIRFIFEYVKISEEKKNNCSKLNCIKSVDESTVYNKDGDILKITFKAGGEMIYTYKYDEYNNWIEKTEKIITVSKSKSEISDHRLIKRTIVYDEN